MNTPDRDEREIVLGLTQVLRPALARDAGAFALAAARDVAQVLGLAGLDAVLAQLERHIAHAAQPAASRVAERVRQIADDADARGSVLPFREADAELAALGAGLPASDTREAAAPHAGAVVTVAAAEQLADLLLEGGEVLARARLTLPVASALRAALDWMGAGESGPVVVSVHDAALTLTTPITHASGLGPAGAVLASIEGSLGTLADARWVLRVPLHAERPSFLLLRQGHLSLALPWHSVARLRMLGEAERATLAESVLPAIVTGTPGALERPGALVALGLKRAWLFADRIVWRIVAQPEEGAGPFAPFTHSVSIDGGERYWIAPAEWLLRDVAPIAVAPPAPRARAATASVEPAPRLEPAAPPAPAAPAPAPPAAAAPESPALRTLTAEFVTPELAPDITPSASPAPPGPPAASPAPRGDSRIFSARLEVLGIESVRPLTEPASRTAAPEVPPAPRVTPSPPDPEPNVPAASSATSVPSARPRASATPTPAARRPAVQPTALIADDSLVARIFLARLLERRGYQVECVVSAAELWTELAAQAWDVVLVDVALPDARGREHLGRVLDHRAASASPYRVIALTRDAADERDAIAAGAGLTLRKPFEAEVVDRMLNELPRTPERPS